MQKGYLNRKEAFLFAIQLPHPKWCSRCKKIYRPHSDTHCQNLRGWHVQGRSKAFGRGGGQLPIGFPSIQITDHLFNLANAK